MHPTTVSDKYAHLELAFSPNANLVSVVRSFVEKFYQRVLDDPELVSRLALATHELLENAVKFSADNNTRLLIEVEREPGHVDVKITTQNRAVAGEVEALRGMFRELLSAEDPLQYYQLLMKRTWKRPVGSGLGLGRIRAEALLDLDFTITGDLVELRAAGRHPLRGAA